MLGPAAPGDRWRYALGAATTFVNLLGSGAIEACRNMTGGRGLDPGAVRDAVRKCTGAAMTPPVSFSNPATWHVVEQSDNMLKVHGSVWTEDGLSGLVLDIRVHEDRGLYQFHVARLLDDENAAVAVSDASAQAASAPAVVGEGNAAQPDVRISRAAFVGASYGVMFNQLRMGIEQAVGDPFEHLDDLNAGQRSVLVLEEALSLMYADALQGLYYNAGDIPPKVPAAARRVGAHAYADLFERANALFPTEALGDIAATASLLTREAVDEAALDRIENEIYALERAGDSIWHRMLRYVEAHPAEFFLPSREDAADLEAT